MNILTSQPHNEVQQSIQPLHQNTAIKPKTHLLQRYHSNSNGGVQEESFHSNVSHIRSSEWKKSGVVETPAEATEMKRENTHGGLQFPTTSSRHTTPAVESSIQQSTPYQRCQLMGRQAVMAPKPVSASGHSGVKNGGKKLSRSVKPSTVTTEETDGRSLQLKLSKNMKVMPPSPPDVIVIDDDEDDKTK